MNLFKANATLLLSFVFFSLSAEEFNESKSIVSSKSENYAGTPYPIEKKKQKESSTKSSPLCSSPLNFYLSANFIYWHVSEDFLSPFSGGSLATIVDYPAEPSAFHFKTHYHPGLQVGLGFSRPHQNWHVGINYAYLTFHNRTSFTNHDPLFKIFYCDWILPFFNPTLTQESTAKAKWSFLFHDLDANLFRTFSPTKHWTFNPFLGMKFLLLDQKYSLFFHAISGIDASIQDPFSKNKSDSWGIGPRLGLDIDYLLGKGFYFSGNGAVSLLYQEFSIRHFNTAFNSGTLFSENSLKTALHKLTPYLETKLGVKYEICLCKDLLLALSGFYEFRFLTRQQRMHEILTESTSIYGKTSDAGDLFLHGLTTGVQLRW